MFKTSEIWEIANFIFLTPKEVGLHHFSHKISNIKLFPLKISKAVKVCLKNVLNVLYMCFLCVVQQICWLRDSVCIRRLLADNLGELTQMHLILILVPQLLNELDLLKCTCYVFLEGISLKYANWSTTPLCLHLLYKKFVFQSHQPVKSLLPHYPSGELIEPLVWPGSVAVICL